jgi:DNA polymerase III delta prime subunit
MNSMNQTNDLWIEKYRPTTLKDYYIDSDHFDKINEWITDYKNNTKEVPPFVILHGKPGIGKTTLAHLLFKEHNMEIVETNASDIRNKKQIKETISKIGKFKIDFCGEKTRMGIIMDEIDGISSSNDKGGLNELLEVVSSYKKLQLKLKKEQCKKEDIPFNETDYIINYKNPIICTCNALKTTKFSAMIKQSLVIRLDKCMKKNCLHFIDKISSKEGLKISEKDKNRIYKQTYGDYRQILFQLYNVKLDNIQRQMIVNNSKRKENILTNEQQNNTTQTSTNQTSTNQTSTNQTSTNQTSTNQTSTNQTSTKQEDLESLIDVEDTQKLLSSLNINDSSIHKLNFCITNQEINNEHLYLIFETDGLQYLLNMYSNYIYLLKVLRLSKIDTMSNNDEYHQKLLKLLNLILPEKEKRNILLNELSTEELKKKYYDTNINLVDISIVSTLFQDTDAIYQYIYKHQEWDLFNYTSYINIYYPCLILRKMYQLKKNKPYLYLNYHGDYNYMKQEHSLLFKSYISNTMKIYSKEENTIVIQPKIKKIKKNNKDEIVKSGLDTIDTINTIDTYSIYYQYQIAKKEKMDTLLSKDKTIKSMFRIMDKLTKLL